MANAPAEIRDVYEAVASYLAGLGDDVQGKELKNYMAFKRIKNFACVDVFPQARTVTAYLKIDPGTISLEPRFTRDVHKIGHYGTGDLEVSMKSMDDFAKAQPLFQARMKEASATSAAETHRTHRQRWGDPHHALPRACPGPVSPSG